MGLIVAYSFWTQNGYQVVSDWTFANYQSVFSTPVYVNTFVVTLWMTAAATALTLAIAFPFSYWLARYVSRRWQRPLLFLVILPFWVSYLLRVTAWTIILGNDGAHLPPARRVRAEHTGLAPVRPSGGHLRAHVPLFPVRGADAVRGLGAGSTGDSCTRRWIWARRIVQAVRRVMLPQIKPGLTTAVIFVFIPILGEYLTPELVGGTRGVMIGNLVDNFFQEAQYARRRGDRDPDRGRRDHPAADLPQVARGKW